MKFSQWVGFVILAFCIYLLWKIRELLLLLFTAAIIANFLNHGVQLLQRMGMKRGYAVLSSILLLLAILSAFFWLIIPPFAEQLPELFKLVALGIDQLILSLIHI